MPDAGLLETPATFPVATPLRDHWIGFDLGGTKMLGAVFNSKFEIVGHKRKNTKGYEGPDAGIDRVKQTIHRALEEAEITIDRVAGIGIGVPGPLDLERGVVLETPNLGWKNLPISELLEREFNVPVSLVNDVDAGVYGEYRLGAAQNARCVVGLFPGTGIGGGCVVNGQIWRGERLSCFEVGHMCVQPGGPICGCGRRGCLEAVASRLAISGAAAQAAYRGQAPNLQRIAGTDLANIRSGALAESIEQGDKIIEDIVREAARQLGNAAGALVNLLAPDVILLGGGLVEALPKLFIEEVKQAAEAQAMPAYRKSFKVTVGSLADYAAVKGAAAWAQAMAAKRMSETT